MIINKSIVVTVSATFIVCLLHFISAVYVDIKGDTRTIANTELPNNVYQLPYSVAELTQRISSWSPSLTAAEPEDTGIPSTLSRYDQTTFGDTTIVLLGIYRQQLPVAVIALYKASEPLTYLRLKQGEQAGDIILTKVNSRDITLTQADRQVQLKLFTPALATK